MDQFHRNDFDKVLTCRIDATEGVLYLTGVVSSRCLILFINRSTVFLSEPAGESEGVLHYRGRQGRLTMSCSVHMSKHPLLIEAYSRCWTQSDL